MNGDTGNTARGRVRKIVRRSNELFRDFKANLHLQDGVILHKPCPQLLSRQISGLDVLLS
ncbi:hypothetical protein ES705_38743 [subsurface metagenome]